MSKAIKYILWIVGSFFLLILLALLLTQTAFFREKVKQQIITQSSKFLNVSLDIEKLNGNFYSEIEFENIRVTDHQQEVFYLESLNVKYNLKALLKKEIRLDSVSMVSPKIKIWQKKDSTWNFSTYLVKSQKTDKKESKGFAFRISSPLIHVREGSLEMETLSQVIPKKVDHLNLEAGFSYSTKEIRADLREFYFDATEPTLSLKQLTGQFKKNETEMSLDGLVLRTGGSKLNAGATYRALPDFQADLEAGRIDSSELAVFVPDIHLKCSPTIKAEINTVNDILSAQLELNHNEEKIKAEIRLDHFSALAEKNRELPFYATLLFSQFNLENWMDVNNIRALIEGTVTLEGNDLLHPDKNTKVLANLTRSTYNGVYFKTFDLNGNWVQNTANANLNIVSDFGEFEVNGEVQNIRSTQNYQLEIQTNELNLEAFVPKMQNTLLNATIHAQGAGFDPSKLNAHAEIELQNSLVYNFQLDTLSGLVDVMRSEINIDTLFVLAPGVQARGQGTVRIDSLTMNTRLNVRADSLSILDSLVQLPIRFDSLQAEVTLHGPFSRLQIDGHANTANTVAYDVKLDQLNADFNIDLKRDSLNIQTRAEANEIKFKDFHWDSLGVSMNYLPGKLVLQTGLFLPDSLELELETDIELGDTLQIDVPRLELRTFISDYSLDDTLHVLLESNEKVAISKLRIFDRNNPDFLLQADGVFAMNDINSLQLTIRDFDLHQVNRFLENNDSIRGILNAEFSLTGSPRYPVLSGTFGVLEPSYGTYQVSALNGTLDYNDGQASATLTNPDLGEDFAARVLVPMQAYLDSMNFMFSQPDSFEASVDLSNFDIHPFGKQFVPYDSIKGTLNIHLNAQGAIKNPQIFGNIKLNRALYQNRKHGIDYNNINASLSFEGSKMNLDTVLIQQEKGFITMSGSLAFDSSMVSGNVVASSLKADARNFFLTQNRNYEILIDANTFVRTGGGKPEYGGKVKILRSDIFLPAIMKEKDPGISENLPMLVEALIDENDTLQISDTLVEKVTKTKEMENLLMERLRGRLNVEIPRNTWIRSDDMRLEVGGDIDIVKTGEKFELFGSLEILRGYYLFYGKKLNVGESQVIFEGGAEFDPTLNFKAEYVFRSSDRQKRYLELLLTGKLSDPTISFKLDGTMITENDGVSVLLFGTTSDNIGFSEQQGMIGAMSSQALASMITSQLSRTLGTKLNLDMIEITATDNWQSAAFVVGKYITNDIFVIYERGFGEVDGDEITPETVTIEYELNDKLFLRLQSGSSITSGFDVILKFEEGMKKSKTENTKPKN